MLEESFRSDRSPILEGIPHRSAVSLRVEAALQDSANVQASAVLKSD